MVGMNSVIVGLGVVVAVAAAIRSTWSPCGLSMLSTVTPLAERSRGHRYAVTATWFVLGATLGGATLGLVAAALAGGVRALGPSAAVATALAALAALVTGASDVGPWGRHLPFHRRQVDELWLGRYRPWVYATGFGWQIGAGVATYIMTAAVYLVVVLAALTASPLAALALVTLFGLLRGLAVLLSARLTTPGALHAFHRRFDALGPASRQLAIGAQLAVAVVAGLVTGPVLGLVVAVLVVALVVIDVRGVAAKPAAPTVPAADEVSPRPGPVVADAPAWRPTSSAAAAAGAPTPPRP
jgi:hypothetical protein